MKPEPATEEKNATEVRSGQDRLPLLYQGFLIAVVRVQSKREKILDVVSFRKRMKSALQEVERAASSLNYDYQDIQDAHLAVVAFLDEVILTSDDPSRMEWMKFPLAQDLLGQPNGGEVFFERLDGLLRSAKDSLRLSDVLEVYLLCMTLGFEGKYTSDKSAELRGLMERTRSRIEGIRQRRGAPLSPDGQLPDDLAAPVLVKLDNTRLKYWSLGAAIFAVILFALAFIQLSTRVQQIQTNLRTDSFK
jgi:type VI secretion system protein ImpK